MCKNIFVFICCITTLISCRSSEETLTLTPAKGSRYYGGILRISKSEYLRSLYPPSIIDPVSAGVATQIYDALFYYDAAKQKLEPCLVKEYHVSADSTIYTFTLKNRIFFHDDVCFANGKGRELTAHDIAYCFTNLCTYSIDNQGFYLFKDHLKGANQYYTSTASSKKPTTRIDGIRVLNTYTLQLILEKPMPEFLLKLSHPQTLIYPKEAIEKYGTTRTKAIGTGPFMLDEVERDIAVFLKKNPRYHRKDSFGNQLPLLDGINFQYIPDKNSELADFKRGNIHVMYHFLPDQFLELLKAVPDTNQLEWKNTQIEHTPEMTTYMMVFNFKNSMFKNNALRKAFSHSIDKSILLGSVLRGEGYDVAQQGIIPPLYKKYSASAIHTDSLNADSAHFYLDKAPVPSSLTLSFYTDGSRNTLVALSIAEQLKNTLGLEINLEPLTLAKFYDNMLEGRFDVALLPYTAQLPMPEYFLAMFYSPYIHTTSRSYPNVSHYKNPRFDMTYQLLQDSSANSATLAEAETIILKDAAVLPLWYDEGYYILRKNIKNFPINALAAGSYAEVYFVPSVTNNSH